MIISSGWWYSYPSENMSSSMGLGWFIPYMKWKIIKPCLKAPTTSENGWTLPWPIDNLHIKIDLVSIELCKITSVRWSFPKRGVPPNHPVVIQPWLSIETNGFGDAQRRPQRPILACGKSGVAGIMLTSRSCRELTEAGIWWDFVNPNYYWKWWSIVDLPIKNEDFP